MKRIWVFGIIIFAFLGLVDSFYLAEHEVSGTPLLCTIQNLTGCNIVANSQYSHLFGVPIANVSILLYSIIFIFALLELMLLDRVLRRVLQVAASIGLIIAITSTCIQVFVIQALCVYCLASAFLSVGIFAFASRIEPLRRSHSTQNDVSPVDLHKEPLVMPPV